MVIRFPVHFTRWRTKCFSTLTLTLPHAWMATRLALGVSASLYLATLNNIHADSESENAENPEDPPPRPLKAGFTADQTLWQLPHRYLGQPTPSGIIRMYWASRFDTRVRIMSHAPRTLISIIEGDSVSRFNVADVIQENQWFNLEGLFSWYQRDHSTPQPVEFIHEPHPSPEAIRSVLTTAITFTDEYILTYFLERTFGSPSKKNAPQAMLGAASSCMVSALYEADVRVLHVASLGNMRGILGRPRETEDGKITYDVHVLSVDHSPENPAEKALIESAHEGEDVLADGTLFGRPYTRALGDGKLKWSREVQTRLHRDYLSAAPDPNVKTPPYISAKPDVNSIKILPGDFLVLSSRWLAECLTDEEVVGLVGVWLEKNKDTTLYVPKESPPPPPAQEGPPKKIEVLLPEDLPVTLKGDKTKFFRRWDVAKRFINEDANPSTHLLTNAMGGADEDLREALVQMVPSQSEGNTKSLAIVVAFFQ